MQNHYSMDFELSRPTVHRKKANTENVSKNTSIVRLSSSLMFIDENEIVLKTFSEYVKKNNEHNDLMTIYDHLEHTIKLTCVLQEGQKDAIISKIRNSQDYGYVYYDKMLQEISRLVESCTAATRHKIAFGNLLENQLSILSTGCVDRLTLEHAIHVLSLEMAKLEKTKVKSSRLEKIATLCKTATRLPLLDNAGCIMIILADILQPGIIKGLKAVNTSIDANTDVDLITKLLQAITVAVGKIGEVSIDKITSIDVHQLVDGIRHVVELEILRTACGPCMQALNILAWAQLIKSSKVAKAANVFSMLAKLCNYKSKEGITWLEDTYLANWLRIQIHEVCEVGKIIIVQSNWIYQKESTLEYAIYNNEGGFMIQIKKPNALISNILDPIVYKNDYPYKITAKSVFGNWLTEQQLKQVTYVDASITQQENVPWYAEQRSAQTGKVVYNCIWHAVEVLLGNKRDGLLNVAMSQRCKVKAPVWEVLAVAHIVYRSPTILTMNTNKQYNNGTTLPYLHMQSGGRMQSNWPSEVKVSANTTFDAMFAGPSTDSLVEQNSQTKLYACVNNKYSNLGTLIMCILFAMFNICNCEEPYLHKHNESSHGTNNKQQTHDKVAYDWTIYVYSARFIAAIGGFVMAMFVVFHDRQNLASSLCRTVGKKLVRSIKLTLYLLMTGILLSALEKLILENGNDPEAQAMLLISFSAIGYTFMCVRGTCLSGVDEQTLSDSIISTRSTTTEESNWQVGAFTAMTWIITTNLATNNWGPTWSSISILAIVGMLNTANTIANGGQITRHNSTELNPLSPQTGRQTLEIQQHVDSGLPRMDQRDS